MRNEGGVPAQGGTVRCAPGTGRPRRHPRGRAPGRLVALGLAVGTLAVLLAACGTSGPSSSPTTTRPAAPPTTRGTTPGATGSSGKPGWIVADWAVKKFEAAGMSSTLVDYFFNNPQTYLIVTQKDTSAVDRQLPDATHMERFTSYATMQQAFSSNAITPGTRAIMYDNEAWSFTPANEKAAPFTYAQMAENLVHQHGMTFVFAPAVNLAALTTGGTDSSAPTSASASTSGKYSEYLSKDLAGQGARTSDVFDVQAQQAEATSTFGSFTTQAIHQATAANSRAEVYVGIGPNPNGRTVSAADILADYQAVRPLVAGYWLNLPAGTSQCPGCGSAQPQVAVSFLESLAHSLGQPTS